MDVVPSPAVRAALASIRQARPVTPVEVAPQVRGRTSDDAFRLDPSAVKAAQQGESDKGQSTGTRRDRPQRPGSIVDIIV